MCDHAAVLAPRLAGYLGQGTSWATVVLVRVLGFAGAGYEDVIAAQLAHAEEAVVREALRALVRIGSVPAAEAVGALIRQSTGRAQGHAEEALWRLPAECAHGQVLGLLQHQDFVRANPDTVARLLDRIGRTQYQGLEPAISRLVALRFRFWNPALRRVGVRAQALLHHV
jgi:hypothetical protein